MLVLYWKTTLASPVLPLSSGTLWSLGRNPAFQQSLLLSSLFLRWGLVLLHPEAILLRTAPAALRSTSLWGPCLILCPRSALCLHTCAHT